MFGGGIEKGKYGYADYMRTMTGGTQFIVIIPSATI